jgi:DNA modification methylase
MTPHYTDDWLTLYGGDCREVLASLPADSVDCVVTSPPYWGLRDYGSDGQLGLERTPEEYVANLVQVFQEVRRVLKPSGTCWLNLGDSYASSGSTNGNQSLAALADKWAPNATPRTPNRDDRGEVPRPPKTMPAGLKPKDLVGIPWRVAFALQADGWYLRSDIIWSKPNPMPESVTDRPTKSHEYLFLLTKSPRYFFDADAVREPNVEPTSNGGWQNAIRQGDPDRYQGRYIPNKTEGGAGGSKFMRGEHVHTGGRNIRSVWTIATRPYPGAHFAVFPPELPERCIKAGSPTLGVVLDPFGGSGTVGMVANRLSRRAILIDLNPEYLKQQMRRNAQTPLGLPA